MPLDSVSQNPLHSPPSARFDHRHKGPQFVVLPPGPENLTAALTGTNANQIVAVNKVHRHSA